MTPHVLFQRVAHLFLFTTLVCAAFSLRAQTLPAGTVDTNNIYLIDLPNALRLADAQNLDIQIARERLNEAKANRESALEQFFPWISPKAGYQRHENRIQAVDGTMLDADKQSYTAGGMLAAQVDVGDAIYRSLAAKQLVKAADHGLDSQRQDSTLFAAQGYYELAKTRATVDVIRESLRISEDYQKELHEAVGIGVAFKGDELRVRVQTEHYQLALRQAVEQQRIAAARLAQILHLDPSVELVAQTTDLVPLTFVETNAPLSSLVQQALRSRPELKQNQDLVSAARETKNGAVYGPLIPSLSAQAFAGGLGGGKNGNTENMRETEDYFVGIGWRIGPGGLFDMGRVHASKARLETTRLSEEKQRDQIIREVVESQTHTESLRDQLDTTKQNLATASEALRLTRERKQYGVGVVLEDIQAQQDLTRARSDYLNTVAEYNKAEYGLSRAIGGRQDTGNTQAVSLPTR